MLRSLKRQREASEYFKEETRETQRAWPADYSNQQNDQQTFKNSVGQGIIKIQCTEQPLSPPYCSVDVGISKQEYRLRRKPAFNYDEEEVILTEQQHCMGEQGRLPLRSQIEQKQR